MKASMRLNTTRNGDAMDDNAILDAATADLFTLDPQAEPAEDLSEYACSVNCTDDGCTRPSTDCTGTARRSGRPLL